MDGWMDGSDVKAVLEIEPGNKLANESAPRLEKLQKEKMEAMKDEALGEICPNPHSYVRCRAETSLMGWRLTGRLIGRLDKRHRT